jgi:hypothetical protein
MFRPRLRTSSRAIVLALVCACSAFSSTIVDSDLFTLTPTNFPPPVAALSLDQFNPSLGKLNSIKLEFTITDQYSLQLSAGATNAI